MVQPMLQLGIVLIGRNEGDRLKTCLNSIATDYPCVYVDSGSTDDSVNFARSLNIDIVELDVTIPFTAARARNEGVKLLKKNYPELKYVQFVDGDCEVVAGWLEKAQAELDHHSEIAIVCGRRRERFPEASVYNLLCDLEWDTPVGEAVACGGDFMIRLSVFEEVGGFNPSLIAGEEPELCLRIRHVGWKIQRLDAEMTLHDADMSKFSQWWRRAVRGGHAYAERASFYWQDPEVYADSPKLGDVKQLRSCLLLGFIIPLGILVGLVTWPWMSILLLLLYPLYIYKVYNNEIDRRASGKMALLYALYCCLGRFPQLQGQTTYFWNQWRGKNSRLIEYKS